MIWFFLRPHLSLYIGIVALSLLAGVLTGFNVASLSPLINALSEGDGVGQGGKILIGVQKAAAALPFSSPLVAAASLLFFFTFLRCLAAWSSEVMAGYTTGRTFCRLKDGLLQKYIQGGYPFFLDNRQGEVVYNVYVAVWRTATLLGTLPLVFAQVMSISVLILLLLSISAKITAYVAIVAVLFYATVNRCCQNASFKIGQARKDAQLAQHVFINEFINGFKQLFVYRAITPWFGHYQNLGRVYWKLQTREAMTHATPGSTLEMIVFGGIAVFVVVGFDTTDPASLTSQMSFWGVYLVALVRLLPLISGLGRYWVQLTGYLVDASVVYRDIQRNDLSPAQVPRTRKIPTLQSEIVFDRVCFSYPGRQTLFNHLSVSFQKGKTTALVGASGAGKSTIINLLLGVFKPTSGSILVDGVDLAICDPDSWLSQIGFVSQDAFIFNATIRENLAFSRPCTEAELEEAARIARAHHFIREFPEGYNTVVGERGMKLSGGQQQRLALARAILAQPQILLLDEATSSLDAISEKLIQEALEEILVGRTVILIAHRLSTIKNADKILVLKEGTIVEEGGHQELIHRKGHYWELYDPKGMEQREFPAAL